ncbi:hypothetical protein CY34DRAFT_408657 [Suillus luteus UH-Slu-Lm8-n1]|uniref:Uncharacterized protein n=1 Tax=Suillus luteus UH-Slu-Lm8-n1 TaxID=930992 RepID=A0A0D0A8F1_9AGAM|nr:hypothetical protein CY34DRAFT_408657 [Suillus luteus UH-Slu-Lm8-n1]
MKARSPTFRRHDSLASWIPRSLRPPSSWSGYVCGWYLTLLASLTTCPSFPYPFLFVISLTLAHSYLSLSDVSV